MDYPVYTERRNAGGFDIDFASTSQDPSPSRPDRRAGPARAGPTWPDTAIRRWTRCSTPPRVTSDGAGEAWHAVLRRIEDDAPAVFIYAPSYMYAVHRRFTNVRIRPESAWLSLREWTVGAPGARRPAGD